MTYSKREGDFVFRELKQFNTALLANMATRVFYEPEALWVRVLKGIYFPTPDFMQANKGSRASWGWSSLLVGRDVIRDNRVWCVGDGRSIRTFLDRWVTMRHDFRIHQTVTLASSVTTPILPRTHTNADITPNLLGTHPNVVSTTNLPGTYPNVDSMTLATWMECNQRRWNAQAVRLALGEGNEEDFLRVPIHRTMVGDTWR